MKKKINSRGVVKVEKVVSEFSDLKKLRRKHFIQNDRNVLFKRLNSDEVKIKRLIKVNLEKVSKDIKDIDKSKKDFKKIVEILDEDLKILDSKLRVLKSQKTIVAEEKKRLSKKRGVFAKRLLKLKKPLSIERAKRRIIKKDKVKVKL